MRYRFFRLSQLSIGIVLGVGFAAPAVAQVTPAAGYTPPDDTPAIRLGATIFIDYTVQDRPKVTDADGNQVTLNQFNVQRAYINVTGQINHIVQFRITPDIARETGAGSTLTGSYTFRLKYAYAQFNLDDWFARGTYARFGMQQTPWVNFIEDVYRYRFQGPTFEDREAILSSADFGATFRYNFNGNYGDVHGGYYNGDNYNRVEPNDQKGFMVRASVRPLPVHEYLRGLRIHGFYDHDAYVKNAERRRTIFGATYEHTRFNAGGNYLWTTDQTRTSLAEIAGNGFTIWATPALWGTPKTAAGVEALLRYDFLRPNEDLDAKRRRTIVGVSYWFPRQGNVSAAMLFDFEDVDNNDFVPVRVDERRYAVHMLINF